MRTVTVVASLCVLLLAGCNAFGYVGEEEEFDALGPHQVIERKHLFSERSYHYVPAAHAGDRSRYEELFGLCRTDCNERLAQHGFSPDGEHYAFRVHNSNRYRSGTRLLLFSFRSETVHPLVDLTEQTVTGYRFTDSTLVYTVRGGPEGTISLTRP